MSRTPSNSTILVARKGNSRAVERALEFIPAHWGIRRFKGVTRSREERNTHARETMLSLTITGHLVDRSATGGRQEPVEEYIPRYLIARPDDLVVNPMWLTGGSIGVSDKRGAVSPDYRVFEFRDGVDPRFMHAVLRSAPYFDQYRLYIRASTTFDRRIRQDDLDNLPIPVPPLSEQRRIAEFLDREATQMDALIAKQKQLIAGLRKRRIAVIASETLRGIDPLHVPRGTIVPFVALGHGYLVTLGKMLDAARNVRSSEQMLPYIRAANIQDDGLRLDDVNSMPFSATEARSLDLRAGDVLVVEGGAVGTSIALAHNMPGWSFQKTVNRLRPSGDWNSRFIAYVLRTYRDIGVIDVICNKSTIPHLTAEKLRSLRVPAPPAVEQCRIADYLDEQTVKIDALIAEAEEFIALARERRAALITEAVTGRIDVSMSKMREGA